MAKTLEQLRAEKERAETQLAQEQRKLQSLENRKKYLEKGERQKRTRRLCIQRVHKYEDLQELIIGGALAGDLHPEKV